MQVGIRVKDRYWEVGSADFLRAFFSTISYHLEPEGWGTRFPYLMQQMFYGVVSAPTADAIIKELNLAKGELAKILPSEVVWDIENIGALPPWGENISPDITNLSNYFVTSDGKDLFDTMWIALDYLKETKSTLHIE